VTFVPTRRLAALAFVAVLVAIAAGFVAPARTALWVLDAVIVLAALLDLLATLGPRVEVERQAAAIFSVGRANVVTLRLRSRRARRLRGSVTDDPLPEARCTDLPARFELPPHGEALVTYELTPTRRGPRDFHAVTLRHSGPLSLVARQERTLLPARVNVYPDVHASRMLEMLRRQGRQDARLGSLRVRGGDTEFERLRPYVRGDEIRHVDWRATARRDDMTVRQFQAESNQNVVFALDMGRGMRGESGGLTSIDHALNAALLAADVALRGGDKAGLLAFDDAPRTYLPPTGGRTGARKLTIAVHALEAGLAATDYRAALMFLRTQVRTRSLIIVFTNLLEARSAKELASSLRGLLPRHLPLCVLMRDMDIESLAVAPASSEVDLYVRAAAAETLSARDTLIRSLRKNGVLVLDAPPGDVTPSLVKSYLEIKARRLL
jgi:uncharacterized protein (DUF58 family)